MPHRGERNTPVNNREIKALARDLLRYMIDLEQSEAVLVNMEGLINGRENMTVRQALRLIADNTATNAEGKSCLNLF